MKGELNMKINLNRRQLIKFSLLTFLSACTSSSLNTAKESQVTLIVSVAASLQDAMKPIAEEYSQQKPDVKINYNFGSSGSLQQQIELGASADIFISASPQQMNELESKNLLLINSRKSLLTNQVVLITYPQQNNISKFEDLTNNQVTKIAIGEPESVPAGQYAKEVLTSLNLYKSIENKLIFAKDVRQVLSYVETGNVDAGIVYATDAKLSNKIKEIIIAPDNTHSPIIYPIAILKNSKNIDFAQSFIDFLFSDTSKNIFKNYGFTLVSE